MHSCPSKHGIHKISSLSGNYGNNLHVRLTLDFLVIFPSRNHASLVDLTHDLGISDAISYLIGADDVKKAKPNPEPVLNVLEVLGHETSKTLVVGDMNVDILMGVHAGTKTCGVTYGNGTKKELEDAGADYIINSIDELIEIVNVSSPEMPQQPSGSLTMYG